MEKGRRGGGEEGRREGEESLTTLDWLNYDLVHTRNGPKIRVRPKPMFGQNKV